MRLARSSGGTAAAATFARGRPDGCEAFASTDDDACLALVHDQREEPAEWSFTPVHALFAQGRFGPQAGPWLFAVGLWTPREHREDFLGWYEREHLPILLGCHDWHGCRFVEAADPRGCQFFALHQLGDVAALDSRERACSRDTPWFHRLKRHDWFDEAFTRKLYRRVEGGH
jgi:hypothetical protein